MKRSERVLLVPLALAAVACALLGARVTARLGGAWLELGRSRVATVSAATRARLAALEEPVAVTWYRTPPAGMPSHLRGLEEGVRACLAALRDASDGRFEYRVADPDELPEAREFLASAGVAPWRARRVERDGWTEARVWSSLAIAHGPRPLAVVNGVGPDHLPELQRLILAEVDELARPRRPVVALDAPEGYGRFREELARGAEVVPLDLESGEDPPEGADLVVWIAPSACGERELSGLDRFLARGGSAVVAGGALEATGAADVRFRPTGFPARAFLAHFGLRALDGLLLDAGGGELAGAPWLVPCLAPRQDFRALRGQPNGTLVLEAPTAFEPDPERLAERGLEATVLGKAREGAVLVEPPREPLAAAALARLEGRPAPNAGLLALLRPADPWSGSLVYLASASPFADARFDDERFAHAALARVLAASLLSTERRVASRIALERPEPLRELGGAQRALWRAFVVGLPPALVLLPLLRRLKRRAPRAPARQRGWIPGAALLLLALAVPALLPASAGFDLTRDGANLLTASELDTLERLAARAPGDGPVVLESWFSAPDRLPPELRPLAREARRLYDELALRSGAFEHRAHTVGPLDEAREAELAALGIPAGVASSRSDEATTLRRVVGALRVARGGEARVVELTDPRDFDALRFRAAFALWRLATGREARVALAAEPPRLSPAEAALEYQRKGLFPPGEGDPYSELRALLERAGFRVQPVDPARPAPLEAELLLWVQPRRDAKPLLERASAFLSEGGAAIVAAQHYRVQARQLGREGLALSFWPQPQFPDLDRHYLPELGIHLERELVLDPLFAPLELRARVERKEGGAELVSQPVAQPFLVRAAETGFAPHARALRGLGDLLLPGAARIAWDADELARRGIAVQPWIATSARAWAFAWEGGDLPPEVLAGTARAADERAPAPWTLAALFRGSFPRAEQRAGAPGAAPELALLPPEADTATGETLLIGCSEMWRNERIHDPRFRHDRLALAAAAELSLEPELAAFLHHRAAAPGIGLVSPGERTLWRALVLGAFPLALVVAGLLRRMRP